MNNKKSRLKKIKYEGIFHINHARILTPLRYLLWHKKLHGEAAAMIADFNMPYSKSLARSMIWNYCAHYLLMDECILFDCRHHSYRENEKYIGSRELAYYVQKVNDEQQASILRDKYESWCLLKEYYGRRVVRGLRDEDISEFTDLVLSHEQIFVKPIDGASGRGAMIAKADTDKKARLLFRYLRGLYPGGFVAEELIEQCPELASFHPQSVNTVRMATIRHDDYVRIWHPFFRVGKGESVVDNADSGGIEISVDPKTGILGKAADMRGNRYTKHPETGKSFAGYRLPRWREAVELATKAAQKLPDVRYIGWDLALTKGGWVIVEGNNFAFMDQATEGFGFKQEFLKELRDIRHNK